MDMEKGKVLIIEENKIKLLESVREKSPVVIRPGKNILLKINGKVTVDAVEVTGQDKLELVLGGEMEPKLEYNLIISSDCMEAVVQVTRECGVKYKFIEMATEEGIFLDAVPEQVMPEPVSYGEVVSLLKARGVIYGIKEDVIKSMGEAPPGETYWRVAEGTPPTPPQDAWIEYMVPVAKAGQQQIPQEWSRQIVQAGQVLAVKHPVSGLGTKGINVFGQFVEPCIPKDVHILCGPGVELTDNGNVAVAAIDGRVMLVSNRLYVQPVLEINDDLSAKAGAVAFPGDVVVNGNVLDGAAINARGQVIVNGDVIHADLNAGGEIKIKGNVINSFIRAGAAKVNLDKALQLVKETRSVTEQLLKAAGQVKHYFHEESNRRDPLIIKLLLDQKYSYLPALVDNALTELKQAAKIETIHTPVILKEMKRLRDYITTLESVDILQALQRILFSLDEPLVQLEKYKEEMEFSFAHVTCNYLQNSIVQGTGNVTITGKGAYMSTVETLGSVVLAGFPGNILGGFIKANGIVRANQIGSPTEVKTKIVVPRKGNIKALRLFPGVEVSETCLPRQKRIRHISSL